MNIEQIKSDLDAGIMVSRATMVKLVEAALVMQRVMESTAMATTDDSAGEALAETLAEIETL